MRTPVALLFPLTLAALTPSCGEPADPIDSGESAVDAGLDDAGFVGTDAGAATPDGGRDDGSIRATTKSCGCQESGGVVTLALLALLSRLRRREAWHGGGRAQPHI